MQEARQEVFTFGEFVLDLSRGTLQGSGEDISLRPQTFEVFSMLARKSGNLVSKDELHSEVWHGIPVTDDSLTQCIVEIRKAIGDRSRTIIRTVPKRGYIFYPPEPNPGVTSGSRSANSNNLTNGVGYAGFALAAIAVIVIAVLFASQFTTRENNNPIAAGFDTSMSPNSIAVLPFADMSEAQDQQYFGDGIAEEILSKLTEYPDLVVIARTSSFLFRDGQQDVAAMGRSLNAAHVLEGSIRKSGSRLRITAQLIETRNGTHVWSKPFDAELNVKNVLDIQSEVAASVAESIATGASPVSRHTDTSRKPANAKAYDLYLEGMFYLQQIRTAERVISDPDIFDAAIARFEASIDHDPDWAPPHVAIGRTLQFRAAPLDDSRNKEAYEWYQLSKQHILEAIRLDPDYALAYSSLGHVLYRSDFDFTAAEAAYARARELGGYVPWSYGSFLTTAGRPVEAIEQYKLAIERDPLSIGPRRGLVVAYRCAGRYADSITELEKVLRMWPAREDLHIRLAYLYLKNGDFQRGREIFEEHAERETHLLNYGPIYALLGMTGRAYEVLEKAEKTELWWLENAISTALLLGEKERALNYMESAINDDPRMLLHVHCLEGIPLLAGNTRYEQLLSMAGFPGQTH